jgi:hypothetical protein
MGPKDLAETISALLPTRRPLFIWGPPGIGKSDLVHQAAKANDMDVIDLRAVLLDPIDLRGLPHISKDKRAVWCPPAFLPLKGAMNGRKGIIFADELPQAAPLVQAAFLQGILDHRIGETQLDEGWQWIAAGNRTEDRAGSHRIITPLLNRFGHLDLDVDNAQWQEWAAKNGVASEVRSFLNFRPALLHHFDPARNERAFPTPRSWAFVSGVLKHTPDRLLIQVVSGFVGPGPAAEFVAFIRTYQNLPDIDALLKNPTGFTVPTDPSVLYAFSGALAERAKGASPKTMTAMHAIVDRLPDEYSILTIRDACFFNRDIVDVVKVPAAKNFFDKNKSVLIRI